MKEALKADLAAFQSSERADRWNLTDSSDPYWAGKQMGMLARLALIADELGMEDEVCVYACVCACMEREVCVYACVCACVCGVVDEPWPTVSTSNMFTHTRVHTHAHVHLRALTHVAHL